MRVNWWGDVGCFVVIDSIFWVLDLCLVLCFGFVCFVVWVYCVGVSFGVWVVCVVLMLLFGVFMMVVNNVDSFIFSLF